MHNEFKKSPNVVNEFFEYPVYIWEMVGKRRDQKPYSF
jgi:hypothetical protein